MITALSMVPKHRLSLAVRARWDCYHSASSSEAEVGASEAMDRQISLKGCAEYVKSDLAEARR
jgi:hypothetical protein